MLLQNVYNKFKSHQCSFLVWTFYYFSDAAPVHVHLRLKILSEAKQCAKLAHLHLVFLSWRCQLMDISLGTVDPEDHWAVYIELSPALKRMILRNVTSFTHSLQNMKWHAQTLNLEDCPDRTASPGIYWKVAEALSRLWVHDNNLCWVY